jgi:Carboxypeptidase regulatory-like domain/TonB dependent receptor
MFSILRSIPASRLLKNAAGTARDGPGGLSHQTTSAVCRHSGTGFLACPGLFQQSARVALAMLAVFVVATPALRAQLSTADIVGTITDQAGAVIVGAAVTAENLDTHEKRATPTNGSGDFVFNLVPPGPYTVTVQSSGFKLASTTLTVVAGDRARADIQLQIGEATQTIEIQATTPALQTDSAALRTVVTEQSVQDLPLNGRNYVTLVQSTVGVGVGPSNSILSGTRPDERRQTANVTANGQNEVFNNQMIDGMDNNEREQFTILMRPSIDMISEVKVETNAYSAEVGRAGGAVVNLITKSGTNQWHGGAYEYFRNDLLNANDFFSNLAGTPRPKYRQNQFGGSFGGPIRKDKTFFFVDTEALRIVQGVPTGLLSTPTLFEEKNPGNFSDQPGGPIIPPSLIDPVALNYWGLWPAPNVGPPTAIASNYSANVNKTYNSTTYDARIDHSFSAADSFFARFSYNPTYNSQPSLFPPVNGVTAGGGIYPGPSNADAQGYMADYVHIFSPTLVMELKTGFTRLNLATTSPSQGTNQSQKFGMPNTDVNAQISGLATVYLTGFVGTGSDFTLGDDRYVPIYDINNVFQDQGSLTWTKAGHNVKFGGGVIRRQLNYFQNTYGLGYFEFLSTPLANLENLIQGTPTEIQRQVNYYKQYFRFWEPAVYVQDDWRAKSWLTLNIGLRWDHFSPITSAVGERSNYDLQTLSWIVGPTAGVRAYWTNFEPRFGFAVNPRKGLVIRGGFGMSRFPQDYASGSLNLLNAPFVSQTIACFPAVTSGPTACPAGSGTLAEGAPIAPIPALNNQIPGVLAIHALDYPQAYIIQYNLTIQKQFGPNVFSMGYVGELARHLQYAPNINIPPPSAGALNPLVYSAVLPNVTTMNYYTATGASEFNSAQFTFERRYSKGITTNVNYTFARNLTNISDGGATGAATVGAILPLDRAYDWGNSDIGIKHRISIAANYEIPFGRSANGWRKVVYGGWQANTLAFWQSGTPFTVLDAAFSPALSNVSTLVTTDRPNVAPGQSYAPANQTYLNWINVNAFTPQIRGTVGDEMRDQLYGPHQRSIDFSLFKDFPIKERSKLQFRAEVYNLANFENFGQPNVTITGWSSPLPGGVPLPSGQFGQITASNAALNPRLFQLVMKLIF